MRTEGQPVNVIFTPRDYALLTAQAIVEGRSRRSIVRSATRQYLMAYKMKLATLPVYMGWYPQRKK